MNKKKSNLRKRRLKERRLVSIFLFIAAAVLFFWLAFRIFTATDCKFFGSKLALVIVPACNAFGNQGAAAFLFLVAAASLVMLFLSLRQDRNPTRP
jgi:hypothetical protein